GSSCGSARAAAATSASRAAERGPRGLVEAPLRMIIRTTKPERRRRALRLRWQTQSPSLVMSCWRAVAASWRGDGLAQVALRAPEALGGGVQRHAERPLGRVADHQV